LSGTRAEKLESLAAELGERVAITPCNLSDGDAVDALPGHNVIKINLESYFRLAKACLRPMMKARSGRIIGITSIVGVTGNPGQTNYAASKAGMIGFSKSLAQEVASRGITVNCIAPGFIRSPMTDALNDAQKEATLARIPAAKLGEGQDIAAGALYLASDEGAYVTGQTLHINGGMAMI